MVVKGQHEGSLCDGTVLYLDSIDVSTGCDLELEFYKMLPLGKTG